MINVLIWNEYIHEKEQPEVAKIYPQGIHKAIGNYLAGDESISVKYATLDMPRNGITKEILEDTDGKVDIVVAGIGTGGTAIGIKKGLGDKAKVYGVEPFESPLITNGVAGPHKIQGIGANFITDIYKSGELDGVITVKGNDAIKEARNLAKTKGIMCGISSGANLYAAKQLAKQNPNKLIVTIMCDFGERYLSTELFE